MGLLEKIASARGQGRKSTLRFGGGQGFSQPLSWQNESPLLSSVSLGSNEERIGNDFDAYIDAAYKQDGVVYSAIGVRAHIFSQVRFAWREFNQGQPGALFGNQELQLLERPGPGKSTGNLLSRMEIVASLAGNWFGTRVDDAGRTGSRAVGPGLRIAEMRPDWVTIIIGSNSGDPNALDAKIVGYLYESRVAGSTRRENPVTLLPDDVCHYNPEPDPAARARGMSWLTPILREVDADKAATVHKAKFFENGATPGIAIKFDKDTDNDAFNEFVERYRELHEGAWNAYKTLFLAAGADVEPLSMDLRQLDFKNTQGAGETRIAMASGIHPVILGASEGLQGSSLNQGNFGAARRLVADKTMRHLWTEAAASLETLVTPPSDRSHLWFDTQDVAFLREDARDIAEIQGLESRAIRTLLDAGYDGESVVEAVMSRDWSLLVHTGLFSVQLQPPRSQLDSANQSSEVDITQVGTPGGD